MADKKRSQINTRRRRRSGLVHPRSNRQGRVQAADERNDGSIAPQNIEISISTSSSPLSTEFVFPDRQRTEDLHEDAGDTQALSNEELADSESVVELVDEGQAFEADAVQGVEEAPEPDQSEVRVHRAPAAAGAHSFKKRNSL